MVMFLMLTKLKLFKVYPKDNLLTFFKTEIPYNIL